MANLIKATLLLVSSIICYQNHQDIISIIIGASKMLAMSNPLKIASVIVVDLCLLQILITLTTM
jgi:hypothetical protein